MRLTPTNTLITLCFFLLISFIDAQINLSISHRGIDDGSTSLTKEDSSHIKNFSIENLGKKLDIKTYNNIEFELINSSELKEICSKSKYTWVFIQASWCGACISNIKKNLKIMDSIKNEDIRLVVISEDFQIKQLQKKIVIEKYNILSYIINPKDYGTAEAKKQELFIKGIAGDQIIEGYSPIGVPKNFFFNQKGALVYYDTTYKITTELINQKVFGK